MRHSILWWLPILILSGCTTDGGPTEAALLERLEEFNQAFSTADSTALADLITQNYRHVNGNSRPYTRSEWLGYIGRQRQEIANAHLQIDQYKMTEIEVQLYGNSALITGIIHNRGSVERQPFNKKFRVTHWWVWRDKRWKRAAFHDGQIQ